MAQPGKPDVGVLGLALVFFLVGMQGVQWLRSPPLSASSTRYWLVIVQLIFGFGLAAGMMILTVARRLRR
jgi:hypothetical protein